MLFPQRELYVRLEGGNLHRAKHARGCWRGQRLRQGRGSARRGRARRIHACPCRAQRERARRLREGSPPLPDRAAHLPRSRRGRGGAAGNTRPRPRRFPLLPRGSGLSPARVGPRAAAGTGLARGEVLVLAAVREKRLLAGALPLAARAKRPPAKRRCWGGQRPSGHGCPRPRLAFRSLPPRKREARLVPTLSCKVTPLASLPVALFIN